MELSPFKSITGSDTFWDGSIPNPLSVTGNSDFRFPDYSRDFGSRTEKPPNLGPGSE